MSQLNIITRWALGVQGTTGRAMLPLNDTAHQADTAYCLCGNAVHLDGFIARSFADDSGYDAEIRDLARELTATQYRCPVCTLIYGPVYNSTWETTNDVPQREVAAAMFTVAQIETIGVAPDSTSLEFMLDHMEDRDARYSYDNVVATRGLTENNIDHLITDMMRLFNSTAAPEDASMKVLDDHLTELLFGTANNHQLIITN
jgi:hypothetical protein